MKQTELKQNHTLTMIQLLFQWVTKGTLFQAESSVQLLSMIEIRTLGMSLSSRDLNPLESLVPPFWTNMKLSSLEVLSFSKSESLKSSTKFKSSMLKTEPSLWKNLTKNKFRQELFMHNVFTDNVCWFQVVSTRATIPVTIFALIIMLRTTGTHWKLQESQKNWRKVSQNIRWFQFFISEKSTWFTNKQRSLSMMTLKKREFTFSEVKMLI